MPEKQLELFHIVQVAPSPFDAPPLTAPEPFSKPSRQDATFASAGSSLPKPRSRARHRHLAPVRRKSPLLYNFSNRQDSCIIGRI